MLLSKATYIGFQGPHLYSYQFLLSLAIKLFYIALFWVLKALYIEGGISSTTTTTLVHLDDATAAILRQNTHHTPAYWW